MTESDLNRHRRELRRDPADPSRELVDYLAALVRRIVRAHTLPPSAAPYGQWDDTAAEEVFQSWYAEKLHRAGDLQQILDRARTAESFDALAARSFRQHVLNMRRRGASQNLYRRLSELLRDEPFVLIHDSTKSQNRVYALAADKSPFSGREQELLSLAWSLGDFTPIRYRASARKTTPVLSTEDLQRFVTGLMAEADGGLSLGQIVVVLSKRFDLDEAGTTDLESATTAAEMDSAFDALALKETANALIDDLTERQRIVLCRRGAGATIPEIARELQCSPATVFNDETRIGQVITEESADNEERDELLKFLIDLLCS